MNGRPIALLCAGWLVGGCALPEPLTDEPDPKVDAHVPEVDPPDAVDGGPSGVDDDCITARVEGERLIVCGAHTFYLSVPPACVAGGCGVVVDVHGATMDGRMEDTNTDMRAIGVAHGYIVVQPNANPEPPLSMWFSPDDEAVVEFAERVLAVYDGDRRRVHVMGFSSGGYLTWRLLCAGEDLFASAAPAAAALGDDCGLWEGLYVGCHVGPGLTADILYMHGTRDAMVADSCADQQIAQTIAALAMGAPETVSSDAQHRWLRYRGAQGITFEVIRHDYQTSNPLLGGHCFPGGADPGDAPGQLFPFHCEGAAAFHWGEAAMAFFVAHPKE